MPQTSPVLSLPYIQPSQAQKHVTHNEALRVLDAITQLSVIDDAQTTPPGGATDGDRYIVPVGATEAWAGQETRVAIWVDGAWQFFAPDAGWQAVVAGTGAQRRFDGTAWVDAMSNLAGVGVGALADATNKLSVSADATLLSHAGGGHQMKLNKNGPGDTASLLFQTGFSGRAEMGTTGNDDFAVKVSADGTNFSTAFQVEAGSGAVQFPQGQAFFQDMHILNDQAWSIDVPWADPARLLVWMGLDVVGHSYLFALTGALTGAANFSEISAAPAGSLGFQTGALTGTTGPANGVTLSIDITGGAPRLYVENRLGTDHWFTLATLGK
ncbi:MAG: DUF2793 domain-containing protein [Pseudomonadota bacterium]